MAHTVQEGCLYPHVVGMLKAWLLLELGKLCKHCKIVIGLLGLLFDFPDKVVSADSED